MPYRVFQLIVLCNSNQSIFSTILRPGINYLYSLIIPETSCSVNCFNLNRCERCEQARLQRQRFSNKLF